jgi:hypothetical protein
VAVHFAAVACERQSLLQRLLTDPASLRNEFLPGMPEDVLAIVRTLVGATATYRCPCGERFFAGNCGRMSDAHHAKCPNCGNVIFRGEYDRTAGGAQRDDALAGAPRGYSTVDTDAARNLPLRVIHTLRFIVEAVLLVASVNTAVSAAGVAQLVQGGEPGKILITQLLKSFRRLAQTLNTGPDETALALHLVAGRMSAQGVPSPDCSREEARNQLEQTLSATCIEPVYGDNLARTLQEHMVQLRSLGPLLQVMAEIEEREPISGSRRALDYRMHGAPCLFLPHEHASLQHLQAYLDARPARDAPVLRLLLKRVADMTPALAHFPAFLAFQRLVYARFSRAISAEDAETKITLASLLEQVEQSGWGHPIEWRSAWLGFKSVWSVLKRREVRQGCKAFVVPELTDESFLLPCLARRVDAGRCVLAIMDTLLAHQNEILAEVQRVAPRQTAADDRAHAVGAEEAEVAEGKAAEAGADGEDDQHRGDAEAQLAVASALPLQLLPHQVIQLRPAELEQRVQLAWNNQRAYGDRHSAGAYNLEALERFCVEQVIGTAQTMPPVNWPLFAFKEDCDVEGDLHLLEQRLGTAAQLLPEQRERVRLGLQSAADVDEALAVLTPLVSALVHTRNAALRADATLESVIEAGAFSRDDVTRRAPFIFSDAASVPAAGAPAVPGRKPRAAPLTVQQLPALCRMLRDLHSRAVGLDFSPAHSLPMPKALADRLERLMATIAAPWRSAVVAGFRNLHSMLADKLDRLPMHDWLLACVTEADDRLPADVSAQLTQAFQGLLFQHSAALWQILRRFDEQTEN